MNKKKFKAVGDAIVEAYKKREGQYCTRYSYFGKRVKRVKLYAVRNPPKRLLLKTIAEKHGVVITQKRFISWSGAASITFYISEVPA